MEQFADARILCPLYVNDFDETGLFIELQYSSELGTAWLEMMEVRPWTQLDAPALAT